MRELLVVGFHSFTAYCASMSDESGVWIVVDIRQDCCIMDYRFRSAIMGLLSLCVDGHRRDGPWTGGEVCAIFLKRRDKKKLLWTLVGLEYLW